MNDSIQTTPVAPSGEQVANLRQLTMVTYILYAVSALVGITAIVAIVINYVKRDAVRGTLYESHFTWQIRTFWWGLLWGVIGFATVWLLVGFAVLLANSVWLIYRVVRGFLNWNDSKPMPV
jgi:uncharacterized membrane protein